MSDIVQYLTDEGGQRTAALLPISAYEKLLEDLDDLAVVAELRTAQPFRTSSFFPSSSEMASFEIRWRSATNNAFLALFDLPVGLTSWADPDKHSSAAEGFGVVKGLPLLAVLALGCGGTAAPLTPAPTAPQEKTVSEPSSGTIEALLAQVEALPEGTKTFELFVPQNLTWQGRPVPQNIAMAIVLDKLLGKQLYPDGFDQRATGRRYKYKPDPPK